MISKQCVHCSVVLTLTVMNNWAIIMAEICMDYCAGVIYHDVMVLDNRINNDKYHSLSGKHLWWKLEYLFDLAWEPRI